MASCAACGFTIGMPVRHTRAMRVSCPTCDEQLEVPLPVDPPTSHAALFASVGRAVVGTLLAHWLVDCECARGNQAEVVGYAQRR